LLGSACISHAGERSRHLQLIGSTKSGTSPWRELERLIQEGHLTPRNPEFTRVIDSASQALGGADDDARAHIFSIVDWAEDNA
jgi:hypothetical protein